MPEPDDEFVPGALALVVRETSCEWCAVWIGRHAHMVRDDGTLGVVVLVGDQIEEYLNAEGDTP